MADSPFIIDITRENFQQVIEASFKVPVLVDFWASWCQPCLALMPILARLAEEYGGKFLLGKLNTEEEQEIAARFGIRSIPNVKLFRDGQPVDEFMGALPEAAVREFIDRHVARESDAKVAEALEQLRTGNVAQAQAATGDVAAAEATLDGLPPGERDKPEVATLRSHLFFENELAGASAAPELEARLEADPEDHEALYQLAVRKVVDRDYDAAMELLLELMRKDRSFGDDAGRSTLLKVFDMLGDDPRVGRFRSRMSSLLY
jgi:putative thioredoxin